MDPLVLKEIGEELRRHRIALKLTLEKISKILKIRREYLEAIERGDFKKLPSTTYIIGYVKQYAQLLKLNFNEIVKKLKDEDSKMKSIAPQDLITEREFLPSYLVLILSLALALLLYLLVYWFKLDY